MYKIIKQEKELYQLRVTGEKPRELIKISFMNKDFADGKIKEESINKIKIIR